jgi:hypothetical protein
MNPFPLKVQNKRARDGGKRTAAAHNDHAHACNDQCDVFLCEWLMVPSIAFINVGCKKCFSFKKLTLLQTLLCRHPLELV